MRPIDPPRGRPQLRSAPPLANMELLRKGSRLSVQPVRAAEGKAILDFVAAGRA